MHGVHNILANLDVETGFHVTKPGGVADMLKEIGALTEQFLWTCMRNRGLVERGCGLEARRTLGFSYTACCAATTAGQ